MMLVFRTAPVTPITDRLQCVESLPTMNDEYIIQLQHLTSQGKKNEKNQNNRQIKK